MTWYEEIGSLQENGERNIKRPSSQGMSLWNDVAFMLKNLKHKMMMTREGKRSPSVFSRNGCHDFLQRRVNKSQKIISDGRCCRYPSIFNSQCRRQRRKSHLWWRRNQMTEDSPRLMQNHVKRMKNQAMTLLEDRNVLMFSFDSSIQIQMALHILLISLDANPCLVWLVDHMSLPLFPSQLPRQLWWSHDNQRILLVLPGESDKRERSSCPSGVCKLSM